ncbi:DUF1073 domain-containing protein [Francisella tularensis]|uniref:phage portal protein n=1 Tax=Francisella tularensis TaxID=263 RepID=UPI0008F4BACD|nr:DUF1073 domain-containing protein [Francisella tularensis]APA83227.1 Phage protein [Francisella tularensis subsp. novicida PA10-7858]
MKNQKYISKNNEKDINNDIFFSDELSFLMLQNNVDEIKYSNKNLVYPEVIDSKGNVVRANNIKGFASDSKPTIANMNSNIDGLAVENNFLGYAFLSSLQQNPLVHNICKINSDGMTEKGLKVYSNDDSLNNKVQELEKELKRLNVEEILSSVAYKSLLLGVSYIYPKIKNDQDDLENELLYNSTKISKGSLQGFLVLEPLWTVPIETNTTNPLVDDFYKPKKYSVMGKTIDCSRIMRVVYSELTNILAPLYLFGGISLSQQVLPFVNAYQNTKKEIIKIVSRYNTNILKTNTNAINTISGNSDVKISVAKKMLNRIKNFILLKNNHGIFALNQDEEFQQIQMNLTGLVDILQQQAEAICAVQGIPVSKLFGQAPRGMNATGEHDLENFNQGLKTNRKRMLETAKDNICKICMLNLWGEIEDNIYVEFNPPGTLDEYKQSDLLNDAIDRMVVIKSNGGMTNKEFRDNLLNLNNFDINLSDEIFDDVR